MIVCSLEENGNQYDTNSSVQLYHSAHVSRTHIRRQRMVEQWYSRDNRGVDVASGLCVSGHNK